MKLITTVLLTLITYISATHGYAQTKIPMEIGTRLDSIFPVDNIKQIKVTNIHGTYVLTSTELLSLKEKLKKAKFAGALWEKPGHIILEIKLKDNATIKSGLTYASTGLIFFDNGIDKFKENFSGTFILPDKLNFDDYQ